MLRRAVFVVVLAACSAPSPRMHVTRKEVPAGEAVVVHLEDAMSAPRAGALWVTLAPAGAPASFTGERVVVGPGATHVALRANAPGRWEVRLHDDWPRRPHHLVARTPIEVAIESASATFMSK